MAVLRVALAVLIMLVVSAANAAAPKASEMRKISSFVTAGGADFKRKPQRSFFFEDRVVFLTMIGWEPVDKGAGRRKVTWRWYSNGTIVAEVKATPNFNMTPFETLGTIPASALGVGNHRVEIFIDGTLFDTQEFSVAESKDDGEGKELEDERDKLQSSR